MSEKSAIRTAYFPASFAQERLWLLDRLEPGDPTYNMGAAIRFTGALNVPALHGGLNELIRRHEVLRTVFDVMDGTLKQAILPALELELQFVEAPDLNGAVQEGILDCGKALLLEPFDLGRGPLLRAKLLQTRPDEYVLFFVVHHIVCDGWSLAILTREWMKFYAALCEGTTASLSPLPIQYADFAHWQKQYITGEFLKREVAYWKDRLHCASALDLPTDYARPPVQKHFGARQSMVLSDALPQALFSLARKTGTTHFMVMLAGLNALIYRYIGSSDISIGCPVAGRSMASTEGLIGCFLNTLVLRTAIPGEATFTGILNAVREATLEAFAHQNVPFEKVLEELNPERDPSRAPLFQVFINMLHFQEPLDVSLPGVSAELIEIPDERSKFDLTLYVEEKEGNIRCDFVYNTELFSAARIEEMMRQFRLLLTRVAENPGEDITRFSLVTEEAALVLPDPAAKIDSAWVGAIHEWFARQAGTTPDAVAVADPGVLWSYRTLDELSNRLANCLIAEGIKRGDIVAIYGHRSAALVLAVIGVMKAGAAFLILDPAYPAGRLVQYLQLAGPRGFLQLEAAGEVPAVIAGCLRELALPVHFTLPSAEPDGIDLALRNHGAFAPAVALGRMDLACIGFTSGSTGTPKAVMGIHGSLSHYLTWFVREFSLTVDDRFALLSAIAHDPLQREMFTPLAIGASIRIPFPEGVKEPQALVRWMAEQKVTIANLTPSMARLLEEGSQDCGVEIASLRWALFVGDFLTRHDVARLGKAAPAAECVNLYGATESQRAISLRKVPRHPEGTGALSVRRLKEALPLGSSSPDTQLLILNRFGKPAGIGESGEIHIRSPHIALGYLNDPALTAEKFLKSWFTSDSDDRLYRTGDMGRYLPDGTIEMLGRRDNQVKIRGFRIELGEIEAVLKQNIDVKDAVVAALEMEPAGKQLVAYVVLRKEQSDWESRLRRLAATILPEYMVPSCFLLLEKLPLSPNGKLDRRALPVPDAALSQRRAYVAPRTPVEEVLAGIWAIVLKQERVGVEDNFFDLGGHSLLATQVMSRVAKAFGRHVPIAALFSEPSVRGLAARVEQMPGEEHLTAPSLVRADRTGPLPLSFAQERLWFLQQLQRESVVYNMPLMVSIHGRLNVEALQCGLNEIIRRHEVLRTSFPAQGGVAHQEIAENLQLRLDVEDLSHLLSEDQQAQIALRSAEEAMRAFDLENGPLVRAKLLRLATDDHIVIWVMHHIVSDGWSMGILVQELADLYPAYLRGNPISLKALPIQYADYAQWQRNWLSGEVLERQLQYWRAQLVGVQTLQLPIDHVRPAASTFRGGRVPVRFSEGLTLSLKELSRHENVTLFMTLLGGLQGLLARYSGQSDIVLGTDVANRNRVELEGVIGFFVNELALRTNLGGRPVTRELLHRVREVVLQAHAHQDLPFEVLVADLKPERDIGSTPIFQSTFVLQNLPQARWESEDLRFAPLEIHTSTAKFDLSVVVAEEDARLTGYVEYAADLFDSGTIESLVRHWETLLEQMAEHAEGQIREFVLVSESERRQLLTEWNDTRAELPVEGGFTRLFEAQAEKSPDATAATCSTRKLTYTDLNRRANRIAHYLAQNAIGPEMVVALVSRRTTDFLAALIGILKASAVYLPIDPSYPARRIEQMLAASDVSAVLIAEDCRDAVYAALDLSGRSEHCRVFVLEEIERTVKITANPGTRNHAADLAYVIYTSGSTGEPKGAMVEHAGMLNHLFAKITALQLDVHDVVAQSANQCFDISIWQFLASLLVGGSVHIIDEANNPRRLFDAIETEDVSVLEVVPPMLQALVDTVREENLSQVRLKSLRWVVVTGERLPVELCRRWMAFSAVPLMNAYGPTECSDDVTHHVLREVPDAIRVPIGRPIINTRVYVLDEMLEVAPPGIAGDLYVSGTGVGRGYRNQPVITAGRYLPDPYSGSGERMYSTGDRARWTKDGDLDFLGRSDEQVKIRGHRIEPGEIEATLESHPALEHAIVVTREDASGSQHLIAYVVGNQDSQPGAEESVEEASLKSYLQMRLPEYMIPSAIVLLEQLPITSNGKIDRQNLPLPQNSGMELQTDTEKPRDEIEGLIAAIWASVLKLEFVGARQNFFAVGGQSLLATQVMSRVRKAFGLDLPLSLLFEQPTVRGLAEKVGEAVAASVLTSIPPLKKSGLNRTLSMLSYAQERLWFLEQLEPGNAMYNIALFLRIEGRLDVEMMQRCIDEVMRRHEGFRTSFRAEGGVAAGQVQDASGFKMQMVDLRKLGIEERARETIRIATADAEKGFDLTAGAPMRIRLLRLDEEEHLLLWTMHHIISDGWSHGVLTLEIRSLYVAYVAGRRSPLKELSVQYADYAAWQRAWLQGPVLEKHVRYWRKQLAGAPTLNLPMDFARPEVMDHSSGMHQYLLPPSLDLKLRAVARRNGATFFMTLLACFQFLLSRYSGLTDIVVGTDIANRRAPELEDLIGFFVNEAVLRTKFEEEWTFRRLLQQVRETTLGAYLHQDLPFERVVQELAPERRRGESPLFQVKFVLHNVPNEDLEVPGLRFSRFPFEHPVVNLDLTVFVTTRLDGFQVAWKYSSELFEGRTIAKMHEQFAMLLEAVAANPDCSLEDLSLACFRAEKQHAGIYDVPPPALPARWVHQMFEEKAEETPEAVALVCGREQMKFGELEQRANQVARYLSKTGVGRESRVGICMERGIGMVVGMLGVLKAGAAYVPLDPTYPWSRLEYMIWDAQIDILLTQENLLGTVPETRALMVCIDRDWPEIGENSIQKPGNTVDGQNLAYIIYTSGSTGHPKGAMITHAGLANYLQWATQNYTGGKKTNAFVHSSISFDLTVTSLYCSLLSGGRAVLTAEKNDLKDLVEGISSDTDAAILKLTPSHLQMLTHALRDVQPAARHTLVVGGEALRYEDLSHWRKIEPDVRIINEYGPTETVVGCCVYEVTGSGSGPVPIGRPIANTALYIVNSEFEPVSPGVVGELFIAGACLGRGYWGKAEITAERFMPDPFAGEAGSRMYRTGDLVRLMPAGEIEYIGRQDDQIKVRGYRIELGEIEAGLREHRSLREAVVVAKAMKNGEKRLVGYVVGYDGETPGGDRLGDFLRERLPSYMVPAEFVALERLPLTSNGKVDRRKLAEPDQENTRTIGRLPQTAIEQMLAGIWMDVLGQKQINSDENFFRLGGHSLLATRVMSRIKQIFGCELSIGMLFDHPTVAGLAEKIEEAARSGQRRNVPPLVRSRREPGDSTLPLSYAQERLWFIEQMEPGSGAYNIPVGVRLGGSLDLDALERSMNEIVRRHEVLRSSYIEREGAAVQRIAPELKLTLEVEDLSGLEEQEREEQVRSRAMEEARRSFDLEHGPLVRMRVLRLGSQEHVVLWTIHHIVSDGWSMGVLVREMGELYVGYAAGEESKLKEPEIQYADYAAWQRNWLQGEVLEEQLGYWRKQLAGVAKLELPPDHARPARMSHRGEQVRTEWDAELTEKLRAVSQEEGATLFIMLLAGLQAVLWRYSGQQDIAVGTVAANRNRVEVEELIGLFVNTLVIRGEVEKEKSFRQLLREVRERVLEAQMNQDVPFEKVVEELAPERGLGHNPLFQVMFAFESVHEKTARRLPQLPHLAFRELKIDNPTLQFDLDFHLEEHEENLMVLLSYRTDLYSKGRISSVLAAYKEFLSYAAKYPDFTLGQLDSLLRQTEFQEEKKRQDDFGTAQRSVLSGLKKKAVVV